MPEAMQLHRQEAAKDAIEKQLLERELVMVKWKDKGKMAAVVAVLVLVLVSSVIFAARPGGGPGGGPGGMGGNIGQVEMSQSVISVKLTAPTVGSLSRETDFIGKIEPAETVNVYPEISEQVTKIYVEAGQTVKAGDLLFEMDDSDAQLSYQIAQVGYEQRAISADTTLGSGYDQKILSAESSLKSAQQNLNNARLKLKDYNDGLDDSLLNAEKRRDQAEEAMKQAELAYNGYTGDDEAEKAELYDAWTAAEQEYLMYRAAVNELEDSEDSEARDLRNSYKNAQASYEQALENYNLLMGGSLEDTQRAVEAELKSAELSLEQSASQLDKYKVYALIDGVIETKSISLYEKPSTGTAAFTISNKDNLTVSFNASSDGAAALSLGDAVTVTKGGQTYTANVYEIDSKADESTGLFPIKAQLENGGESLLTGVSVKVTAATQKAENALLVPNDAVYYEDGQAYVFTYVDGKAVRTDFTPGMSNSEWVVAEDGLDENSQIITTWHPDLKDGVSVVLQQAQQDTAAPQDGAEAAGDAANGQAVPQQGEPAGKPEGQGE